MKKYSHKLSILMNVNQESKVNSQMVVAYWKDCDSDRDHVPDVICLKAMTLSEWLQIVTLGTVDPLKSESVHFGYDCQEPSARISEIINNTVILNDEKLVKYTTSILPECIASHRDMFLALQEELNIIPKSTKLENDNVDDVEEEKQTYLDKLSELAPKELNGHRFKQKMECESESDTDRSSEDD